MSAAKNEAKRNEILKNAYRLYSSNDTWRVSLSDIAEGSEISKSLLQHYFPHRKDIIESMIAELLEKSYQYMKMSDASMLFQRLSDFNMIFFKAATKNKKFCNFVEFSISEKETLDIWINTLCRWLRDLCGEETFNYLQLKTAFAFSMTGSMHLFLHRDELNTGYRYICENHMKSLMRMLGFSVEDCEAVCENTRKKTDDFDVEGFLDYCSDNISWFSA